MAATSQSRELFEDYEGFVGKFRPKKTTDDCYTPPEVYAVVLAYAVGRYGIDPGKVVRPFWPGGDYEAKDYPEGCCVVDNPPFSMLARIIDFYQTRGVPFFLFAPTLTCLSSRKHLMELNHIVCHSSITYENGAKVNTSFVTNLETDGTVLESAPDLSDAINAKDEELQRARKRQLPKYEYPDHVITAAKVNWLAAHHTPYRLNARDCAPIAKLDAMGGRGIFGGVAPQRARSSRARSSRARSSRARSSRARSSHQVAAERPGMGRRGGTGAWARVTQGLQFAYRPGMRKRPMRGRTPRRQTA